MARKFVNCETCGKNMRSDKLESHIFAKHTNVHEEIEYLCTEKGCKAVSFVSKYSLDRHINAIHTKKEIYICSLCDEQFYDISNLAKHKEIHLERVKCRLCNKTLLKSEIASHDKTKIHKYKLLNADITPDILERLLIHNDEYVYKNLKDKTVEEELSDIDEDINKDIKENITDGNKHVENKIVDPDEEAFIASLKKDFIHCKYDILKL
jgi:phage FluMu protein Com